MNDLPNCNRIKRLTELCAKRNLLQPCQGRPLTPNYKESGPNNSNPVNLSLLHLDPHSFRYRVLVNFEPM